MTIFWITLLLTYFFSLIARLIKNEQMDFDLNKKPNIFLVICVLIFLTAVSGLRANIGDTNTYKMFYLRINHSWENLKFEEDFGFYILQIILKQFSDDPQILLILCAFLTNTLIIITLYKYSRPFELSIYLYITSGMYLVTMNGMRQYLAAAIIFYAIRYIENKRFSKYLLCVLLASTIHFSALIMIPIYFVVNRKAWSLLTVLLFIFMILITVAFDQFNSVLFGVIENSKYGHYSSFEEGGANIFRALFHFLPVILAFIGRERLRELWNRSDIVVNMSILNFLFYFLATQNWIFARFSIYFGLSNLILIPMLIFVFVKKDRLIIYMSIMILYLIYFYYEQAVVLRINYESIISAYY